MFEPFVALTERVDGKVVLELGAGVGITGIALAKWAQPTRVVMTDYLANVIDNLNHNIEISLWPTSHSTFLLSLFLTNTINDNRWS